MATSPVTGKAPEFELTAAVSGRIVRARAGRRLVLVFHGPKTTDAPKQVGKAVRADYPDAGDVLVANIVDLRSMDGMWRRVAEAGIKANYDRMAGRIQGGDPADYIVICPDWDGRVCQAFGVQDPNERPGAAVLDGDGNVVGVTTGTGLAEDVLRWLG